MKLLRFLPLLLLVSLLTASCGDDENDYYLGGKKPDTPASGSDQSTNKNKNTGNIILSRLEFPKAKGGLSEVIVHSTTSYGVNYAIEWDHSLRAQRWTAYAFYKTNSVTHWSRGNWEGTEWGGDPFQLDPMVPYSEQPSVRGEFSSSYYPGGSSDDYFNRGHICASQDRMCSKEVNEQTFYMTNMMPQVYSFNSGIWEKMEKQVRNWNTNSFRDTLFVVKGGTIDREEQILTRTRNQFIVPRYFFMALLCKKGATYKALGFWVEHLNTNRSGDPLSMYVVNIDELEQKTGIDFFCNLPDATEEIVESQTVENIKAFWGLK